MKSNDLNDFNENDKVHIVRFVAFLIIIFTVVCVGLYSYTSNVSTELARKSTKNNAELYAIALEEFRTLYTSEVVGTAKGHGLNVTHDYQGKSDSIPLPATLSMLLGEKIGEHSNGAHSKLYSPYPFPWRKEKGGLTDEFSKKAWNFLKDNPDKNFYEFTEYKGRKVLRLAKADPLRQSCVNCHNSHPQTPKNDWQLGDVRGVLEVIIPYGETVEYSEQSLQSLFWLLLGISALGIFIISYFNVRVKKATLLIETNSVIKERVNKLNDLISGEQEEKQLAKGILSYLAPMIGAHQAAFFSVNSENKLVMTGGYARSQAQISFLSFQFGEGLVGQCALNKRIMLIENIPDDYITIDSGLGKTNPKTILLLPIVREGAVLAVLEFAALGSFSTQKQEFLLAIEEIIGVAIQTAKSRESTNTLLKLNQEHVIELKNQQETLQFTNIELKDQAVQLKASEEELKVSEEELKQQSEELKASNEELEEQQESLKLQTQELMASKKEIEETARELALASKYKSEFLANMSHELRTPLNSLLILSKLLAENKKQNLTDEQVEDLSIIHQGGQSLLGLINDIMDLSKVEAGMLNINLERFNPTSISNNLVALFTPIANEKGLQLLLDFDPNLPHEILTDQQRLEQILKNFLSNAFKFTQHGSVTISIKLDEKNETSLIAFSIIDTGIGIERSKQKPIFESFQQADGSTSREYGGTGLGLSISRELASLLGGVIELKSEKGEGSTFTLLIPVQSLEDNKQTPKEALLINQVIDLDKVQKTDKQELCTSDVAIENNVFNDDRMHLQKNDKSLLVIEDDADFVSTLISLIHSLDFKAIATNKGREGVLLANEFLPKGILLDLGLPDINGIQVLEQLKDNLHTRHIPVHVLSGSDKKLESLHLGALSFLQKPAETETIVDTINASQGVKNQLIKQVLVVEDDKANQIAIKQLIETSEIQLSFASTGKQACDLIAQSQFNCIILDLGLPDISGTELVKTINQQPNASDIPIIIYTGKTITAEEQNVLSQLSSSIVIKGAESPERLLDDVALFLHHIDDRYTDTQQATLKMLHDENAMLKDRRVLVVDDDMRNVFAITKVLESVGLTVSQAENGQVAIDKINAAEQAFELILMDVMMPVMDGLTATKQIRKIAGYQSLPIISLTAKAMPSDQHMCIEAGASEYLTKPLDTDKLLSILRVWLYKRVGE